ncbi:MAG: hypothetical protein DRR19_08175 [Candidatus Parabeggiatoa sp. nov. 1]|nr:MAG: hypothetical protein DRR19_08175 [Gammaproteobacteria bacterium]HEC84422.1 hypothetical protein [Thioploca sp.]
MSKSILQPDTSYSFADYFKLSYPTKDIVAEFGYGYELTKLSLPHGTLTGSLERLQHTFYTKLPHISLTSEAAKREMLVAPIILELLDYIQMEVDIEYPLYVDERLHGNLDYFMHSSQDFVIVAAKQTDLERGFSQLAVELIAMARYRDEQPEHIYGAVTVGDLWRFGMLDRQGMRIVKDIDSFRVPLDLDELFQVFIGILQPE